MLWRITPYLEQLDRMIGMKTLKDSILYQVMYYLKGFHLKNKNEEYLHTMIMGSPGSGKCLGKNTPVIMYDGQIKMVQNIKKDELIMGDDSTPRTILSVCNGKETMYKIKQLYGDDYIVNESHILSLKLSENPCIEDLPDKHSFQVVWFTEEKTNSKTFSYSNTPTIQKNKETVRQEALDFIKILPQKGTIIDINITDYLKKQKRWKNAYKGFKSGIAFTEKTVKLDPYIFGVWLGDGDPSGPSITTTDKEIVEYFEKYFADLYIKSDGDDEYRFTCGKQGDYSDKNIFVNMLKKYNVFGNKHIPDDYKINSERIRLSILAGLLDSNSHLEKNCYEIIQKNKKLSDDILFLARSLGFKAYMKECQKSGTYKDNRIYYRIYISGNTEKIPTLLERNKASQLTHMKDHLVYDIDIEKLDVADYYGFTIDGNHRFLLGDFTVTHNTSVARIIGCIYKAMGILSDSGPFKIAYRDDFIAGYLGQTALKTRKLLKSCIGGILFVDEVYSLGPGKEDRDCFSKEALETLTAFLSEHKNDFCFIGAGYEDDIKRCFFGGNKGLESRFQWIHKIDEYNADHLCKIWSK